MKRTWIKRHGYRFLRAVSRLIGIVLFRYRCYGRENVPLQGGALVCSNHQSMFDPFVVGMVSERRMNYLARKSLFRFFFMRWFIEFLDAISIDRDGLGLGGVKQTLTRIRRGEIVLLFPEGTRTRDGSLKNLKPGICTLMRRGKVPLVPVGMDGPFHAWPRSARFPSPDVVRVVIGEPIQPSQIAELSDEQLLDLLSQRMQKCLLEARQRRHRSLRLGQA